MMTRVGTGAYCLVAVRPGGRREGGLDERDVAGVGNRADADLRLLASNENPSGTAKLEAGPASRAVTFSSPCSTYTI
jgi:hypothetical protein